MEACVPWGEGPHTRHGLMPCAGRTCWTVEEHKLELTS